MHVTSYFLKVTTPTLTLETIMALYIRYTVWLIQAYTASKPLDVPTVYLIL